jgi:hypothetical protein
MLRAIPLYATDYRKNTILFYLMSRSFWSVILVLLLLLLLGLFVSEYCRFIQQLWIGARIRQDSISCTTFYQWTEMVKKQSYRTVLDQTPTVVTVPDEPHFILANHISSHFCLGTFLTLASSIHSRAKIVCYKSYNHRVFVSSTMHRVLQSEIAIDYRLSKSEKERLMVVGIREAFAYGYNVVMLIDAHGPRVPIRTLNRVVLEYFPEYKKQLLHIREPTDSMSFGSYCRYPATYDLDDIHRDRIAIIES